ncbi:tRNA-dihydrouridine(47) synthase [NAD(P)(+)]-like isoform X2 [Cylas formicarius]|uniref:tRNA-dihydrouridine(47) synthase [NAD(P)(+)]-like isoform X2 n=1 Tax=Cylas formicarius TaxID=197179 RepID=UPI0029586269|nr:tRNA-dihydrouridine(47) synthase [NAD(P)(+)]-like isoform X2 [Cylas formicarius]
MFQAGICKIKSEYVLPETERVINLNLVSDKDKSNISDKDEEPDLKKQRFSKRDKKKLKGQNKARGPTFHVNKKSELCDYYLELTEGQDLPRCERKNCQNLHDIATYLQQKPKDIGESCYNFQQTGKCERGLTCRFGSEHIRNDRNLIDLDKFQINENQRLSTKNLLTKDLQWSLRKRTYNFNLSDKLIQFNDQLYKESGENSEATSGAITDEDIIKLKKRERKNIIWADKLVLSPLTTVGNLPFRRICKEFGADVTCGEMAMCSSLLQGAPQEWALVKRHFTEDIFGVQLCANNPHLLTKCGQLLEQECEVDFVDLNLGCPIDLVFKQGAGCGLLCRKKALQSCIRNLSDVLSIPLTIKTRTGVYNNQNVAHILAPQFRDWGASMITIHGRSREQRYTKSADWQYIREVAKAASPLPVLGNELAGVMIGRGALIKPWLFKEIKEKKLWDISSLERLDIIKKYVNYGLEHWGSDNKGVENTRRFLLEWLSFLYRYIPVGILEHPPQKINERPPLYKGRDELETLMSSPSASDWIKISEMLLGPVPQDFHFLPKHKASSYQ